MNTWIEQTLIKPLCELFPADTWLSYTFNMQGLLAVILVSVVCGAVGSLVVGNRMAFFSDALAHCAFAGIALGLLLGVVTGAAQEDYLTYVLLVMVAFGLGVGLAIVFVREHTGQANDTIIGVYFAGAIGLGAVFLKAGSTRSFLPPEDFLFGNIVTVGGVDLLILLLLVLLTAGMLVWRYNDWVLASFNRSLALSRRVRVRLGNYLFVLLLALIINLCLKIVGALLINALLIVPAATAVNISRNMRQLFWWSIGLCVLAGFFGHWLSWEIRIPAPGSGRGSVSPGESGTIVLLAFLLFHLSILVRGRFTPSRRGEALE